MPNGRVMSRVRFAAFRTVGNVIPIGVGGALLAVAALFVSDVPSVRPSSQVSDHRVAKQAAGKVPAHVRFADFGTHGPSPDSRHLADWIADSRDNGNMDFIIVDKKQATLYVFDTQARLRGASPVQLGAAVGDDTVPGIGARPIAEVRPEERTTPAGRFVGERGHNARGEDIVWVDYDSGVSIHRVLTTSPEERRLERLASKSLTDKRISWGCINVPVVFYENVVRPTFLSHRALVYVLPDIKPMQQVFGSYDVIVKHGLQQSILQHVATR